MQLCMPVPAVLALLPALFFPARQIVDAAAASKDVFIKLGMPSAATHVLTVQPGEVVEIVIQNDRAGLFGGEYASNSSLTSARNGREQHSFHLHGYHFWQVGPGVPVCHTRQDIPGLVLVVCLLDRTWQHCTARAEAQFLALLLLL